MFQTHSIGSMWDIEAWVQRVAKISGQPVDWYFAGGRVMVLALGDLAKVRAAIRKLMPEHDAMYAKANAAFPWAASCTLRAPRGGRTKTNANTTRRRASLRPMAVSSSSIRWPMLSFWR